MGPKLPAALFTLLPVLLLAAAGCDRGPDETGSDAPWAKEVDTIRLARVGTIGDYPDEQSSVIVNMDPERAITAWRRSHDLGTLKRFLKSRADLTREEDSAYAASKLHVVLRLDRELPWRDAQWLMQTCADPDVRIYRIHFAVLPEEGAEEGTIAAWLPKDRGLARTLERIEGPYPISIDLTAKGPPVEPAALYRPLRRMAEEYRRRFGEFEVVVQLHAEGWVSVGYVLRVMDVICRAGVDGITFTGAPPPRPGAEDGGPVGGPGAKPVSPGIRLFDEDVQPSGDSQDLPPVARKRRGYAGSQGAGLSAYFEEIRPDILEQKPIERDETVIEDPVIKDMKVSDHNEPDSDLPYEEDLGEKDFLGDAPFEGPSTNAAIGIGGGRRPFSGRGGRRGLKSGGGSGTTESTVDLGLEWLAKHQDPLGFWDCDGFMKMDKVTPISDGKGNPLYDPGVTGLALLAFTGTGQTYKHGKYRKTVREGFRYLKQIQDPEGCFGPRTTNHFTYNHAIATLAMAEAYGLTLSPLFKTSAQMGIDFIERCRNPYLAWRYGIRPQDNDTSVSGWMVCALKSAKLADLQVPFDAMEGAMNWLDKITEPEHGRVGYATRGTGPARPQDLMDRFPADKSESLTAVGILSRIFIGENPRESEMISRGTDLCLKALPHWDESSGAIDMYYWYYGSLAMFQVGGETWRKWNEAMKPAILDHQRKDGSFRGSWDPVGPWGGEGGRVYSTALMTLCMEVYYRYPRVFGAGK